MKLIHYTYLDNPLTQIRNPKPCLSDPPFKPVGFWVSDEDEYGWSQWCYDESFRPEGLALAYEITLTKYNNVKIVRTAEGVRKLTHLFGNEEDRWSLNWSMMKLQWDGLIITPYQWALRLDPGHNWYYGWDCASGCIWNPAAIADFKEVDTVCPK